MQALQRMLAVIEALLTSDEPRTAVAVEKKTGLPMPTVSRMLHSMVEEDLLHSTSQGTYRPGTRLISLASITMNSDDAYTKILHECQQLRDDVDETVSVHRRSGDQRVCFLEAQGTHPVRRVVPVGFSVPVHYGAAGACLLAGLTDDEVHSYLDATSFPTIGRQSTTTMVDHVRKHGWVYACDTWFDGLSGLGVPIRSEGRTTAVLSISGPSNRLTEERMAPMVSRARDAAERISCHLNAQRPPAV